MNQLFVILVTGLLDTADEDGPSNGCPLDDNGKMDSEPLKIFFVWVAKKKTQVLAGEDIEMTLWWFVVS